MSRIPSPAGAGDAPAAARPRLSDAAAAVGMAPNVHRLASNGPAALESHLSPSGAPSGGMPNAAAGARHPETDPMPLDAPASDPNIRDLLHAVALRDARIGQLETELAVLESRAWLKEGCAGAGDD